MAETRGPDITAEGCRTEIPLNLPPGLERVEVHVFPLDCAGDEDELFGRWVFEGAVGGPAVIMVDWAETGTGAVRLSEAGRQGAAREATSAERKGGAAVWPTMVVRAGCGDWSSESRVRITDTGLLKGYYQREGHQEQYVVAHPFFEAFHQGRLRCLGSLFRRYIEPGSRVLDVGSGYGIFYMISEDWDLERGFEITCCDLDVAAMDKMRALAPRWNWVVADALDLPWEDGAFDAIYAGEIIEHVPSPAVALSEWGRLLRPGGTMVLSTPNRDRLLARANHAAMPVHHEHIHEMSLAELRAAVREAGFSVLKVSGVYLEYLINWWRPPGSRVDLLTARLGHPRYHALYKASMELGRLAPSLSFDLVVVCRKL